MKAKERKIKEKEATRQMIISQAQEILAKEGLDALTMRSLAKKIEYSQSKIYEFFSTKDKLCEALCCLHCEKLLKILETSDASADAEVYLEWLVQRTLEYHHDNPHSDTLLTLVCFGAQRFEIPKNFIKIEKLFIEALTNLKSPALSSNKEIEIGLNIIRCIFIGTSQLINDKKNNSFASLEVARQAVKVLIRGWKSFH